jgi:exodeoxyribonuclease VII large subunit
VELETVDIPSQREYSVLMQPVLFDPSLRYTVTSLTRRLWNLLESAADLQGVWVEGEISNFSRPSSGHVYFTLKDAAAQLRCVMWRNDAARLKLTPVDGMSVEVHGSLSLYEAGGQYQLYADLLHPLGEGALYAEFLRLKAMLEAEGLFDAGRKRLIPEQPKRIGIVTSPTGAALRDILNTLRRRYPLAEAVLAPTPVQGTDAPRSIVAALRDLNKSASPDVIILARGGGSMEDLWAFNDEFVVRAVVESSAPVITGVGHETDFTLVDFAADLRAPTPTAAAELATPITLDDLQSGLMQMEQYLLSETQTSFRQRREMLAWLEERLRFVSPLKRLQSESQRLDDIGRRLNAAQLHGLSLASTKLASLESRLLTLNPVAVLQRGYAVVTRKTDGATVMEKAQVSPGDELLVRVRDGEFDARVTGE